VAGSGSPVAAGGTHEGASRLLRAGAACSLFYERRFAAVLEE
jgi:hypothetical protein